MDEIINRVEKSGLVTLDMADYYPAGERRVIDLKDQLWQGLALKEKDFREWIKSTDWANYSGQHVAVFCSADAIVPTWAFMLVSSSLTPFAASVHFGDQESLEAALWEQALSTFPAEDFKDARVIIKGCADKYVSPNAFMRITEKLQSQVKSLMFGEACSTVPVYKKK
jgi:hypothetical protein